MASFATKTKKKTHDNKYLQYLQMQLSNMDTISQRNNMIATGQPIPVAPTDNRSMAEKMKDQMYQRDLMYKNLSKLFDKNNEETSIVMSEFTNLADIVNFNNKFPELYGILSSKYAYVKGRQVIDTYNRLIKNQNEVVALMIVMLIDMMEVLVEMKVLYMKEVMQTKEVMQMKVVMQMMILM